MKKRILSMLLALTIVMSMTIVPQMSASAETVTKTVTLLEENFTDGLGDWDKADSWGTNNTWKGQDGVAYGNDPYRCYSSLGHGWSVAGLPDSYDLNVSYRAQVYDYTDGYAGFMSLLGTELVSQKSPTNITAGTNAVNVSINGSVNSEDLTGIYYTTSGDGIKLYDGTDGYNDSNWYTIKITAHIDGVNNATFDYKIYNDAGTTLLAEISNVTTGSYAGSVVEPTYLSFLKHNPTNMVAGEENMNNAASVDDVLVTATYEEEVVEEPFPPIDDGADILFADNFTGSTFKTGWKSSSGWGDLNAWQITDGVANTENQIYEGYQGFIAATYDVSELPDEYDLEINCKVKNTNSEVATEGFQILLGNEELATTKGVGSHTNGANLLYMDMDPNSQFKADIMYMTDRNYTGTSMLKQGASYVQGAWYTVNIVGHIDGISMPTYDIKVLAADGTEIAGASNVEPHGNVLEPTVVQFLKRNASGDSFGYVDDVVIKARYEHLPENTHKVNLFSDNFSDSTFKTGWTNLCAWTNSANWWKIQDGTAYTNNPYNGYWGSITADFDVSELPDKYDLEISYKVKKNYVESDGNAFITLLGDSNLKTVNGDGNSIHNAQNVTKLLYMDANASGTYSKNIMYIPSTDNGWGGTSIYSESDGYLPGQWYTIKIVGHIDTDSTPTYDITILSADGKTELKSAKGLVPYKNIKEPTAIQFLKQSTTTTKSEVAIDDLTIDAVWEDIPVVPETELTIKDFAFYSGDEKLNSYADLTDGVNNLTLKLTVDNRTGEDKYLVVGFGAYKNKYLKAVNFTDDTKIDKDAADKLVSIPVSITKADIDKLSGFVWESLKGRPLLESVVLD